MDTSAGQHAFCPVFHRAVELIGRRWTGTIIRAMRSGRLRFSEIAHAVPGLSDRLLSERLKELECEGIVVRNVYPETPVRIEYELTAKGRDLDEVMHAIVQWSVRWPERATSEAAKTEPESLRERSAGSMSAR